MPSLAQLQAQERELKRVMKEKASEAQKLERKIATKREELSKLEAQLASILGQGGLGAGAITIRKRPRNKISQKDLATKILKEAGEPMNLDELVAAMKKAGYKFSSREPKAALGVALYPDKKRFKRVRPGYFTAK